MKVFFSLIFLLFCGCASKPLAYTGRSLQGLSREQVNGTIRDHRTDVKTCYEQVLKEKPDIQGKVVASFNIKKNGTVEDTEIRGDTMRSESLNACLVSKINSWNFPESSSSTYISAFPFYFHPPK